MMLYPLIIPSLSYILQAWPRIFKKSFGVDVWTRLLEADHVRKNNHAIPQQPLSDQFIVSGNFDYPPVFPLVFSYFPKKQLEKIEGFIAPLFDAIQNVFVYFLAMVVTDSAWIAFASQIIYSLIPMIALENSYLTPRSLGYLNFTLVVSSLLLYLNAGSPYWLVAGAVFCTLIFLTHRFATQSFLFISIFFTYYLNTPLFLQVFLGGFAAALLVTNGYYLRVLKGHLYNIYFWVCNLEFRFAHQVRGIEKQQQKQDWVGQVYKLLSVLSPVAVFGLNPWALVGFVLPILSYMGLIHTPIMLAQFTAWILFFYFFGVVVLKTKRLMPIGEGQRYMEMATVPTAIASAWLLYTYWALWYVRALAFLIALGSLLVILAVQIKGVLADTNRSLTGGLVQAFAFINSLNSPRIVCVPHQNTTLTVYHTKAQVLVNADNPGLMRIQDVYPVLKLSLKELKEKYQLTHALVRTSFVSLDELDVSDKDIVFQEDDVAIVEL